MSNHGGVGILHSKCEQVVTYHSDSYIPLLWEYFIPKRPTLLKLARILNLQSASQDKSWVNALQTVLTNAHIKSEYFENDVLINMLLKGPPTTWAIFSSQVRLILRMGQ